MTLKQKKSKSPFQQEIRLINSPLKYLKKFQRVIAERKMAAETPFLKDLTQCPVWVKKLEGFFQKADLNHDGLLTLDDILTTTKRMQILCKATPPQVKNMDSIVVEFWRELGLVEGVEMNLDEFLKGSSQMMQEQFKQKQNNETNTTLEKFYRAMFVVMDINNDGTISLDELKVGMEAMNLDPANAPRHFEMMDKDKDGKIDFEEYYEAEFNFWFSPN